MSGEELTCLLVLLGEIRVPDRAAAAAVLERILEKLRAAPRWKELPVIMMTARNSEYDRVVGLDAGADDYLSKPFGMMEMVARVRAILRRTDRGTGPAEYRLGRFTVSPARHRVLSPDGELELTIPEARR